MKKWIKRIGIGIAAFFLILLILPFAFKGKIVKMAQEGASSSVNAKITFDEDLSLSLIRNFPNLSVGVNDIKIVGIDSFKHDTLFSAPQVRLTIDIASIIGGNKPINIRKIYLKEPRINVVVLKSGKANYDITKPDTSTAVDTSKSAPISLKLKDVEVENAWVSYVDHSMDLDFSTGGTNLNLSGDFANELFTMKTLLTADNVNLAYGGMTLASKVHFSCNPEVGVDLGKMKFTFDDNSIKINELPLKTKGWFLMNDSNYDMDIHMEAPTSEFKSFLSVVPGCFTKDFSSVKTSGKLGLKVDLKGIMDDIRYPSTHLDLQVDNGMFQYPSLPASVSGIFVDFKFDNSDGNPNNSIVDLKKLKANFGGEPLEAQLFMKTPISNAYAKGYLKTALHLEKWTKFMPLEQNTNLSGEILADFNFDGNYSEMVASKIQELKAEGHLSMNGINYKSPSTLPLSLNQFKLVMNPKSFDLQSMVLTYGKSSINASGKVSNMLGYFLNNEVLHGNLDIQSQGLDLNEWMSSLPKSTETKTDTTSSSLQAPLIPKNLDLQLTANANSIQFQDYNLSQCIAKINVQDGKLLINPIKASLWGSTFELNKTSYSHEKGGEPAVESAVKLSNLNPSKLNEKLSIVNKYAPVLKDIDGIANLDLAMKTNLTQDLGVDLNSVNADGLLNVIKGMMDAPKWLAEAEKYFKWDSKKLEIPPSKVGFAIANGELTMKDSVRLKLPKGGKMSLIGKVNLNQTVDFGGNLAAEGKKLPFKITGTVQNPKFVIDWKGFGKDLAKPYIDKAKNEALSRANEEAEKVLMKVQQQAEQLRNSAHEQAEKIRNEGNQLAEKQRQEGQRLANDVLQKADDQINQAMAKATNPLQKLAAEKAGKILRKEAEKKSNQLKDAANASADKTQSEAGKKADALEQEAQSKADAMVQKAQEERNKVPKK